MPFISGLSGRLTSDNQCPLRTVKLPLPNLLEQQYSKIINLEEARRVWFGYSDGKKAWAYLYIYSYSSHLI